MRSLAETQADFAAAIFDPDRPAPMEVRRPDPSDPNAAQTKRFDVYRNNVVATSIDALEELFPAVAKLVGDAFFRALARAYLDAVRPSSPILSRIGEQFAVFIESFPPAQRVPYLADVARIEFARIDAYHAADAPAADIGILGAIAPEAVGDIQLTSHPSLRLIRSSYPAGSIWAITTGAIPESEPDMTLPEDILIIRPALDVETVILPPGGGIFLETLLEGASIAAASILAAEREGDGFDLSQHLLGAFAAGCFTGIENETNP